MSFAGYMTIRIVKVILFVESNDKAKPPAHAQTLQNEHRRIRRRF